MRRVWLVAIAVVAAACSQLAGLDNVVPVTDAAADAEPDAAIDAAIPLCNGVELNPADEGADHVPAPMPIVWAANPPTSGAHWPDWARWDQTYTEAIPRGYWIHNLEHGGVVLLYNCTDCQAQIDRLTAVRMGLPIDLLCTAPVQHRVIVTFDPLLPAGVSFAAVAWVHSYTAPCLNEKELRAFAVQHYNERQDGSACDPGTFP
jgi:hypothetical protein